MPHTSNLRAQLEQAIIRDLLGPANGPEEIVDERAVRERYLFDPARLDALPQPSLFDDWE